MRWRRTCRVRERKREASRPQHRRGLLTTSDPSPIRHSCKTALFTTHPLVHLHLRIHLRLAQRPYLPAPLICPRVPNQPLLSPARIERLCISTHTDRPHGQHNTGGEDGRDPHNAAERDGLVAVRRGAGEHCSAGGNALFVTFSIQEWVRRKELRE